MKRFEYEEITIRRGRDEDIYCFGKNEYYDFMILIKDLGDFGYELIGEVQGKIILKREITD